MTINEILAKQVREGCTPQRTEAEPFPFVDPRDERIEALEIQLSEQRSLVHKMDTLLRQIQEDYPDVADMPTWSEVYESS